MPVGIELQNRGPWRLALHRLRASWVAALSSVLVLALGIGATAGSFEVITALFREPAIRDLDRLVHLHHQRVPLAALSRAEFDIVSASSEVFESVVPWARFKGTVATSDGAQTVMGELVGGGYFPFVGAQAEVGRVVQPSDDGVSAKPVIAISHRLWHQLFAGSHGAIGQRVLLNGYQYTIVGVVRKGFRGVDLPNLLPTDVWVPLAHGSILAPSLIQGDETLGSVQAMARLRLGKTLRDATTTLETIARQLDQAEHGGGSNPRRRPRRLYAVPAAEVKFAEGRDHVVVPIAILSATAIFTVLLIASVNVSMLGIARSLERSRERAIRTALGATRWGVVSSELREAALLSIFGMALGAGIAFLIIQTAAAPIRLALGVSTALDVRLDTHLLLILVGAGLLTFLIAGLLPAIQATRTNVWTQLSQYGSHTVTKPTKGRELLIATQVAISSVLMTIAAGAIITLWMVMKHDTGLDLDRLAIAQVDLKMSGIDVRRGSEIVSSILKDALPEQAFETVAAASGLPFGIKSPGAWIGEFTVEASQMRPRHFVESLSSSPDILRALGIELLFGRKFLPSDDTTSMPVVILSASAARAIADEPHLAIGKHILYRRATTPREMEQATRNVMVVGVVSDTDTRSVQRRPHGTAFVPWSQQYEPNVTFIARTKSDPSHGATLLASIIRKQDRSLAIVDAGPARSIVGADAPELRILGVVAGALALASLGLTLIGVWGTLSISIAARTVELAVRAALGADGRRLRGIVWWSASRPILVGLVIGAVLGYCVRLLVGQFIVMLFPPITVGVLLLSALTVIAAAWLASYGPSAKASRVDPSALMKTV